MQELLHELITTYKQLDNISDSQTSQELSIPDAIKDWAKTKLKQSSVGKRWEAVKNSFIGKKIVHDVQNLKQNILDEINWKKKAIKGRSVQEIENVNPSLRKSLKHFYSTVMGLEDQDLIDARVAEDLQKMSNMEKRKSIVGRFNQGLQSVSETVDDKIDRLKTRLIGTTAEEIRSSSSIEQILKDNYIWRGVDPKIAAQWAAEGVEELANRENQKAYANKIANIDDIHQYGIIPAVKKRLINRIQGNALDDDPKLKKYDEAFQQLIWIGKDKHWNH